MTIFAATPIRNPVSPFIECLMKRGYLGFSRWGEIGFLGKS
ncbi:hypothetical protein [Brunnivagina elsteri]|nr:hypothetical protein [Calothrix elsteri]